MFWKKLQNLWTLLGSKLPPAPLALPSSALRSKRLLSWLVPASTFEHCTYNTHLVLSPQIYTRLEIQSHHVPQLTVSGQRHSCSPCRRKPPRHGTQGTLGTLFRPKQRLPRRRQCLRRRPCRGKRRPRRPRRRHRRWLGPRGPRGPRGPGQRRALQCQWRRHPLGSQEWWSIFEKILTHWSLRVLHVTGVHTTTIKSQIQTSWDLFHGMLVRCWGCKSTRRRLQVAPLTLTTTRKQLDVGVQKWGFKGLSAFASLSFWEERKGNEGEGTRNLSINDANRSPKPQMVDQMNLSLIPLLEGAALGPVREGAGSQPKPGPSPPSVRVSMSAWSIINSWKKDGQLRKHGSSHETSCIQMDPFPLTFLRGVFCLFRFHLNLRLDQPAEAGEWQWNWLRSFQKIGMWDSGKQLRLEWFYTDLKLTIFLKDKHAPRPRLI